MTERNRVIGNTRRVISGRCECEEAGKSGAVTSNEENSDGVDPNVGGRGETEGEEERPDVEMQESNASTTRSSNCMDCLKCFQVIENIHGYVEDSRDGVKEILDAAAMNFKFYMGRQVRCHLQHEVFEEVRQKMIEAPAEQLFIILMDCKMKYVPKMFRQKSTDWYGRNRMRWHGNVLTFRKEIDEGVQKNSI